jgi:UDP-N-acetyl-2-amino-2-deoxyglucuronate dehydrogenase
MKRFALVGAAGYIAPRHMQAIRDTGNVLIAAYDPSDSVGILDSYFPETQFFTEFERYDRHLDKIRRQKSGVDYVSICSPNYLHDSHARHSLRLGADAICEKPLVLNPQNIDGLVDLEQQTGKRIFSILQLRLHPAIRSLREISLVPSRKKAEVDLTYVTSRGSWYLQSWKGDENKSGGIATNIGVHFFDMLYYVYGNVQHSEVHLRTPTRAAGFLELENARVRWFLSLELSDVPVQESARGRRTYRSLLADGKNVEFSDGFTDLHTQSYTEILEQRGFGLEENRAAIEVVANIRTAPIKYSADCHPFASSFRS